jgi:C-terminal processing protease CtpA/Prc
MNGNETMCLPSTVKLSSLPPKIIILVNSKTASLAEQAIIALFSLRHLTKIIIKGTRTAGLTTSNMYFPLKNKGGIEIPHGTMADYQKKTYPNGIKPQKPKPKR